MDMWVANGSAVLVRQVASYKASGLCFVQVKKHINEQDVLTIITTIAYLALKLESTVQLRASDYAVTCASKRHGPVDFRVRAIVFHKMWTNNKFL